MDNEFVPQRVDYKWAVEEIVEYILYAYGEDIEEDEVDTSFEDPRDAIKKLGYEYEEECGVFPTFKVPKTKFNIGDVVVTRDGGVGIVDEINGGEYSLTDMVGWRSPWYSAWWDEDDLKLLSDVI